MSQQQDILRMLEQAGPEGVTSNQFYAACLPRFSARIYELRNKGFNIAKEPVEQGHFRYILTGFSSFGPGQNPSGENKPGDVDTLGREVSPAAGQLFEVIEDGPTGPVNPYEWEAA